MLSSVFYNKRTIKVRHDIVSRKLELITNLDFKSIPPAVAEILNCNEKLSDNEVNRKEENKGRQYNCFYNIQSITVYHSTFWFSVAPPQVVYFEYLAVWLLYSAVSGADVCSHNGLINEQTKIRNGIKEYFCM